jgi:hypothetical protein
VLYGFICNSAVVLDHKRGQTGHDDAILELAISDSKTGKKMFQHRDSSLIRVSLSDNL